MPCSPGPSAVLPLCRDGSAARQFLNTGIGTYKWGRVVFLRGRCRTCGSYVPPRYLLVETLTGILFVLGALHATDLISIGFEWVLMSVLVVVLVYDLYHLIIPDEFVILLCVLSAQDPVA